MKKGVKGLLACCGITAVAVGLCDILHKKYKREMDVFSDDGKEVMNCEHCTRADGQCESHGHMILNWEECMNTVPAAVIGIIQNIEEVKGADEPLRYSCLEYLFYNHESNIMTCYMIKQQRMVYIKFDLENNEYRYSGRKETLC